MFDNVWNGESGEYNNQRQAHFGCSHHCEYHQILLIAYMY